MSDVKELKRMLNTEEKHVDTTTGTTTVVVGASVVTPIGTVAEGSDNNQRTGRSVKLVRIEMSCFFSYSTGTISSQTVQNQIINWYVVRYNKTPSSSGATAFTISEFLNQDSNANYSPLSLPNSDTSENFTLLASGETRVDLADSTTGPSSKGAMLNVSIPCNFHQTYNSTTAASICDNMCFLVFTAIEPINTAGSSTVNPATRMWYVDN